MASLAFNVLSVVVAAFGLGAFFRSFFRASKQSRMIPRDQQGEDHHADPVEQAVQITFRI